MPERRPAAVVIIGIGNPDRGDDGAGPAVARRLRERAPDGLHIVEHDGEPSSLLALLAGAEAAILIDAAPALSPGDTRRFDVSTSRLPAASFRLSTHGLGLPEAIELARTLGQLPARCVVYAVGAGTFEPGAQLSPPVTEAVNRVAGQLLAELSGV